MYRNFPLQDAVKILQDLNNFEDKIIRGEEVDPAFPRMLVQLFVR